MKRVDVVRLSCAFTACMAMPVISYLDAHADSIAGNVEVSYLLCGLIAMIATTVMIAAVPAVPRARYLAQTIQGLLFALGLIVAGGMVSIPYSGASGMFGVIVAFVGVPIMWGAAIAVTLAVVGEGLVRAALKYRGHRASAVVHFN